MKHCLYLCILLVSFFTPDITLAESQKTKNVLRTNYVRDLLKLQQWDILYEEERQKDVNYLLGSIDSSSLKHLTQVQKEQVIYTLRHLALKQILQDKDFFKDYLINQYSQFFTKDELIKLLAYYKTDLMKEMVKTKVKHEKLTIDDIDKKLGEQSMAQKEITKNYIGSYLNTRYTRFLTNVNPKLDKLIYERMKQILAAIFKDLPNIIKSTEK